LGNGPYRGAELLRQPLHEACRPAGRTVSFQSLARAFLRNAGRAFSGSQSGRGEDESGKNGRDVPVQAGLHAPDRKSTAKIAYDQMNKFTPVAIICVFIWIGFVCAISFMEAWLKFRAPGVSISSGLEIDRLVFNALNKVEWVLATVIMVSLLVWVWTTVQAPALGWLLPGLLILLVPTAWLLPRLGARAIRYIQAEELAYSGLHFYVTGCEAAKVFCLLMSGLAPFRDRHGV